MTASERAYHSSVIYFLIKGKDWFHPYAETATGEVAGISRTA